jgi:hypothetical protein
MHPDIHAYNQAQASAEEAICHLLARQLCHHLPDAEGKIWHGHPVWFLNGNPIAGYSKLKHGVQLLFWSGQSFGEPDLQPEGRFKAAGIRYTRASEVDTLALAQWLAKAHTLQWDYKHLVQRKGRMEWLRVGDG